MAVRLITSRAHPKIKQVRLLRQRKHRAATGLFLVEGIHHVGEAVAAGLDIEYLCYAPDLLASLFAQELIEQQMAAGVPCLATSGDVFASLADKEHPQGLLAVARQRRPSLDRLRPDELRWGVALVQPQDPGNVGTILRTLDAVGADGLLLLEGGADPYHPAAVRASMGALFWHPVISASFAAFARWAEARGCHVYGTSARGEGDYRATAYRRPAILLMGSEQKGLTLEQLQVCEAVVRLPMTGRADSLNLAVAAGVLLYAMREALALA